MRKYTIALVALSLGLTAAYAQSPGETIDSARSKVASSFFDPGPSIVMKVLDKLRFYNYIDFGLNLTSLTEYQVGNILFGDSYRLKDLGPAVVLQDIRAYFANPRNLAAVYGQVKSVAIPALLHKIGQTRAHTWLAPGEVLFIKGDFDANLGKSYEAWRSGGCQWHLQVDPDKGYTPALSKEECAKHSFTEAMSRLGFSGVSNDKASTLVNRAHWYGFLWRRYLEGDSGLVVVWQEILSDLVKAARRSDAKL